MTSESESDLRLEIGHVLFIDLVGYSKLLIDEQKERLHQLTDIVLATPQVAEARNDELVRLPTGDGMALVFRNSSEEPARCALEIARALKQHPEIQVRMGIHSGPVSNVIDLNGRTNIAGAGINLAQRVMDCGDAGHILLSRRVADDLAQYRVWSGRLHDLGECEVKHGIKVSVTNLFGDDFGNAAVPAKFGAAIARRNATRKFQIGLAIGTVLLLAAGIIFFRFKSGPHSPQITSAEIAPKSIAVLPLENLSDRKENAYFADGMQDEILSHLSKVADLKVISRTSVMQYRGAQRNLREIGQQLGVAHVVEGSVQRAEGRVRVIVQLIDARTDAHLWAQTYDRDLADVFAIQSEIAKGIADQLRARISPSEKAAIEKAPTTDLAAYDLYLRALDLFSHATDLGAVEKDLPEAVRLLDEAVGRDPKFLVAWCLLARVHGNLYAPGYDRTPARLELAHKAVQSALQLQPDSGEAHLAFAGYYYYGFRDYEKARQELAIARRALPNSAEAFEYSAYIDRREGRWASATHNLEQALELDPRNFLMLHQLALIYEAQARYAEEDQVYLRALSVKPDDMTTRLFRAEVQILWRADVRPFQTLLAQLAAKNPAEANEMDDIVYALCERTDPAMQRALKNFPSEGFVIDGVRYPKSYWEGVVARFQSDPAKAQAAFSAARQKLMEAIKGKSESAAELSLLGRIDAGLGRKEEAIREGRRACELVPISKDAINGVTFMINLAQIYAWVDEKDLAIDRLEEVQRVPNYLGYGLLKLHPIWDPLRGHRRFETLVQKVAMKARN
jgi:TolB-like protein/Tfp pilus assembly protein PilF